MSALGGINRLYSKSQLGMFLVPAIRLLVRMRDAKYSGFIECATDKLQAER